jgi:hypothetical protein
MSIGNVNQSHIFRLSLFLVAVVGWTPQGHNGLGVDAVRPKFSTDRSDLSEAPSQYVGKAVLLDC